MSEIDALGQAVASEAEPCTDHRYFRFRGINVNLIKSLVNSKLYFARPETLNDPLDCRLDLRQSFVRAASSATETRRRKFLESALNHGGKFLHEWQVQFQNFGIASFSLGMLEPQSTLMWSHYADEHRGVCLLYRFPESFLLDSAHQVFGVDKVSYADNRLTNWLAHEAPLEMGQFIKELVKIYLTAKNPAWAYEHEVRIIRSEFGLLDIPRGYLEQVCFGLRTSQADIDLVTKLAAENCGCSKFCRIVRSHSDFGHSAEEL